MDATPHPPPPTPQPRARRPPLAEVDALALAALVREGRWGAAAPWGALLAGFALVLAGLVCFLWLSAAVSGYPEDRWLIAPLALGLAWFVWRRFAAASRGFALGLVAGLAALTALVTLAWIALFTALGGAVWPGLLGVIAICLIGIVVGLWGLNRLGPAPDRNSQPPSPHP